jgi:hypothetical protein
MIPAAGWSFSPWRKPAKEHEQREDVVPAPTGIIDPNQTGLDLLPYPDVLLRSCSAINELFGEPIRALLAATHLRSH